MNKHKATTSAAGWEKSYKEAGMKYTQPPEILLDLVWQAFSEADAVPKKVLEIGCGEGELAQWFVQKGCDVTGIDLSPTAIERAKQNVPEGKFEVADFMDWQPNKHFDLVVCNLVIAFMPDLGVFYKKVAELTQFGAGLLVFATAWLEDTSYIPPEESKARKLSVEYFGTKILAKDHFRKVFAIDNSMWIDSYVRVSLLCTNNTKILPFSTKKLFEGSNSLASIYSTFEEAGERERGHYYWLLSQLSDDEIAQLGKLSKITFENDNVSREDWEDVLDEMDKESFYAAYHTILTKRKKT